MSVLSVLSFPPASCKGGTVVGWGGYSYGQSTPCAADVIAIAAGYTQSLLLKQDGSVAACGLYLSGPINVPAGLTHVIAVSSGDSHSLALKDDGSVIAWGDNASGQTNVPPNLTNIVAISAGSRHSLALKADGTVVGWGNRR